MNSQEMVGQIYRDDDILFEIANVINDRVEFKFLSPVTDGIPILYPIKNVLEWIDKGEIVNVTRQFQIQDEIMELVK